MSEQQNDSTSDPVSRDGDQIKILNEAAGEKMNTENPVDLPDSDADDDFLAEFAEEARDVGENSQEEGEKSEETGGFKSEFAELEARLADITAELAESRDQLLRKAAEYENSRKRMNQDKQNAIEFANKSLLLDLIPIIDDFERAIQSAESSEELTGLPAGKAVLDGISLIEKNLVKRLESKWGLKRFDSSGEPFDPGFHEAVLMEKSPDIKEPVVQVEYLKGYMLKDLVIRAAQVKVLMPEE